MKTNRLLILVLIMMISVPIYSQDTISRINSSCIKSDLRSMEFYSNYNFTLKSDSVIISGQMETSCVSLQSAIIKRLQDTIVIDFHENLGGATCLCMYDIRFGIKVTRADTLLKMNNVFYNISYLYTDIPLVENGGDVIDAIYDSDSECLRVLLKSDLKLNGYQIFDDLGRLQLTITKDRIFVDMAGFKPGIYFVKFLMADRSNVIMKFIK